MAWQNGLCYSWGAATVFSLIRWLWVREVQKQQEEPCRWIEGYHSTHHTHTPGLTMFLWRGLLAQPPSWIMPSSNKCSRLSFPHMGGLVNPHYYLYFDGFWTTIDSAHPPSLSAAELTSAAASIFLSEFSPRLYLQPLKVHSLAWRHREENQNRSRQARITGETLRKKRRRKNDVNSGDALPEDRAQGWKSLSMPGIVSEVRFTYLLFSFQSVLCYFCLQTKMVGGNY